MKGRRLSPRTVAASGLALLVALVIGVSVAPDLRADAPRALPPATLSRIARNNDHAASLAAAQMRARSETSASQADALRAAEERGRERAEAMIGQFDESDRAPAPPPPAR